MESKLTDRSKMVLQLAKQEAQRFNHEYISAGHLILGLVKEGSGLAAIVLKEFGVTLRSVRDAFGVIESSSTLPDERRRSVSWIIDCAGKMSESMNTSYVGVEHLLLAALDAGGWEQLWAALKVDRAKCRDAVLRMIGTCEREMFPAHSLTITAIQTEFPVPPGVKVTEAQVLRLQPGDVLCLRFPQRMTLEQRESIGNYVRRHFPEGVQVMVLDGGAEMEVIRQYGGCRLTPNELRAEYGISPLRAAVDHFTRAQELQQQIIASGLCAPPAVIGNPKDAVDFVKNHSMQIVDECSPAVVNPQNEPRGVIVKDIEIHSINLCDKPDPGAEFRAAVSGAMLDKLDKEICAGNGLVDPSERSSVGLKTGPTGPTPACPDCRDSRVYVPFAGPAVPCPTCCGEKT